MLSFFTALVPLCHFSKTENGEDFRNIMLLSSYGKSVPENNLLCNPIKEEQKSREMSNSSFQAVLHLRNPGASK